MSAAVGCRHSVPLHRGHAVLRAAALHSASISRHAAAALLDTAGHCWTLMTTRLQ